MSKNLQDQLLICRIAQSESAAFIRLRKICFRPAISLVMQNSGNRQDGEDVYADAEMVVYKKATEGLTLTASIGTYMHHVCKRLWLMELRRRKRRITMLEERFPEQPLWYMNEDTEKLQQEQLVTWVNEAIDELNPTKRTLILLSAYSEMNGEQLAFETGLKDRLVVKVKLSQARNQVRDRVYRKMANLN